MNKNSTKKKNAGKGRNFRSKDKNKPYRNATPWGSTPESSLSTNKVLSTFLSHVDKIGQATPLHKAKQTLREMVSTIVEAYLAHMKTSTSTDMSMISGSTSQAMQLSRLHMVVKEFPVKLDVFHTAAFYDAQTARGRKIVEQTDVSADDPEDVFNAFYGNKMETLTTQVITAKDRFDLLKSRSKELGLDVNAVKAYVKVVESLSKHYTYYLRAVVTKPVASKLDAFNSQIKLEEGDAHRYLRLEKALLAMLRDTDSADLMKTILTSPREPKETLPELFVRIVTAHDNLRRLLEDYEWNSPRSDFPDSISFRTVWSRLHDLASVRERATLVMHGYGLPSTEEERTKRCGGQENWTQLIKDISSLEVEWSSLIPKKPKSKDKDRKGEKSSDAHGKNTGESAKNPAAPKQVATKQNTTHSTSTSGGRKKLYCSSCRWTIHPEKLRHKAKCPRQGKPGDLKEWPQDWNKPRSKAYITEETCRDTGDGTSDFTAGTDRDISNFDVVSVIETSPHGLVLSTSSSRSRILRARVQVRMPRSFKVEEQNVLCDTGASLNIAPAEMLHNIRSCNHSADQLTATATFRGKGSLWLSHPAGHILIECYVHNSSASGCRAILSLPTLERLNVDVNRLISDNREVQDQTSQVPKWHVRADKNVPEAATHCVVNKSGASYACVKKIHSPWYQLKTSMPLEQVRLMDGTPLFVRVSDLRPIRSDTALPLARHDRVDILAIFSGPDDRQRIVAEEEGLHALPGLDLLNEDPWDILDDTHLRLAMELVENHRPRLVTIAPPCTAWSKLRRMAKSKSQIEKLECERDVQRELLKRTFRLIQSVQSYGGSIILENPADSLIWQQSELQSCLTGGTKVNIDLCEYGSPYLKPTTLFVSSPQKHRVAKLLRRRCGGNHQHEKCSGRDVDGINHSEEAGRYPTALLRTFAHISRILGTESWDLTAQFVSRINEDIHESRKEREAFLATFPKPCPGVPDEIFLARSKLREFVARTGADFSSRKKIPPEEFVEFGPSVPDHIREEIIAHVSKHPSIFTHYAETGITLPVKAKPIHIELKEGAQPRSNMRRTWGSPQSPENRILTAWAQNKLDTGEYVRATSSSWCSRPHVAEKPNHSHPDLWGVRVCGDYSTINDECTKVVVPQTTPQELIRTATGHAFYFSIDEKSQYTGYLLDDHSSRILTLNTPIGTIRPTRLQFGAKNAGAYVQHYTDSFRAADLSNGARSRSVRYADDTLGFGDFDTVHGKLTFDWDKLKRDFLEHIDSAVKRNVSLAPSKTRFGFMETQFYGRNISRHGSNLADHILHPVRQMVAPTNAQQVMHVLGVANGFKNRVPDLAMIEKPLYPLRNKKKDFKWTQECQTAFEKLRKACQNPRALAPLDVKKRVRVGADASQDGKGGIIYQLIDESGPDIPSNRLILAYFSKAWKNETRSYPPYYREALALITGLELARPFAECTPWPIIAYTDHIPLTFMKTATKGQIAAWRIERLGGLDYEVRYRPGRSHNVPDALSRYPLLGPRVFTGTGIRAATTTLLKLLDFSAVNKACICLGPTSLSQRNFIKSELGRRNVKTASAVCSRAIREQNEWDVCIAIPDSGRATDIARRLIATTKPIIVLVPADSAHYIPQEMDGSINRDLESWVKSSTKISFLFPLLVWLIDARLNLPRDYVFRTETLPPPASTSSPKRGGATGQESKTQNSDADGAPAPQVPNHPWAKEQATAYKAEKKLFPKHVTMKMSDDLMLVTLQKIHTSVSPTREATIGGFIYVPPSRRNGMIKRTHENVLNHLGAAKVYRHLATSFFWPRMRKDIRASCSSCMFCSRENATRNWSHGWFRGVAGCQPRSRYGMDFYSTAAEDAKQILGIIDLDSLYVELYGSTDRTSDTVVRALESRVLYRYGTPREIRSDHAAEFVGRAAEGLSRSHGYKITTTQGYHPTGNSTIESFWRYLGRCLRSLSDEEYKNLSRYLPAIQWSWNISSSRTSSVTPFEIQHGAKPITSVEASFIPKSSPSSDSSRKQYVEKVKKASKLFAQIAKNHGDFERKLVAELLNRRGRKARPFAIGDQVWIYSPPTGAEIARRSRKSKHLCQWKGPMTVTHKISPTSFTVASADRKHVFHRNIVNLRRVDERVELPQIASQNIASEVTSETISHGIGDFVIVKEPDEEWYSIAQILRFDEVKGWVLWIYGSYGGDLSKDLTKVYVKNGRTLYRHEKGAKPFLMFVFKSEVPELFLNHRVTFKIGKQSRQLSRDTLQYIRKEELVVRLQHHSC